MTEITQLNSRSASNAVTSGFRGTRGFAAPELYDMGTVTFTGAVDVYAFGATTVLLAHKQLPAQLRRQPPDPPRVGLLHSSSPDLPAQLHGIPTELIELFYSCLSTEPRNRPSMATVRDEIARHLLKDKHQALAVFNGKASTLNAERRAARLELPNIGLIEIQYDGLRFHVTEATGEVSINNSVAQAGIALPGSCVVALGGQHRMPSERAFITFDVSHPEVVL